MFKDVVVCKFAGCNQVFNDARILPCGNRTCAAHIDAMMLKSDDEETLKGNRIMIKCHFCQKIHNFPDDGEEFPVDRNIPLLLSMKYCNQHEAAKKSFGKVTKLLDKLLKLDQEDIAIDYYKQVENDILLEKDANLQKLLAHYQKLVDDVHERKVKCLHKLATDKKLESELAAIKHALIGHECRLKINNVDFLLKTLDGDEAKWKAIQLECDALFAKIEPLCEELNRKIVGDQSIQFVPNTRQTIQFESAGGHFDTGTIDSSILNTYNLEDSLVQLCKLNDKQFKLLYRATRDGFGASDFHAKCDNLPNTLTVIKTTKGFIFGGYTAVAWDKKSGYKSDDKAFIFTLVNARSSPLLIPVRVGGKQAIYCNGVLGPTFGRGNDLYIPTNSNSSPKSFSNLGGSFEFTLHARGTIEACYKRVEQHKQYIFVLLYYLSGVCLTINILITCNCLSLANIVRLSRTFVYLIVE